ncbi:MAG: segregation/condensation protein A [Gemmatimonadota bacterium]
MLRTVPAPRRPPGLLQVEPFVVELDRFQGPLDLLLHLIRSQDIDIFDIPIARVTTQFQDALGTGMDKLSLDRAGEFVEMAATLIRVKAQLLLPRPGTANWDEDPRQDLVRRLLEFEHFQDVVHVLATAESQRARHFGKGYVAARPIPKPVRPALEVDMIDFLEAAVRIPRTRPAAHVMPPISVVSVQEKTSFIRELMRGAKRLAFDTVLAPFRTRPHAVASLLACLELAKQRILRMEQTAPFGSIWLFPSRHLTLKDED